MFERNPNLSDVAVFSGPTDYQDQRAVEALVSGALAALTLPKDFLRPGDRVVLKPNWVKEHDERHPGPNQWEHVSRIQLSSKRLRVGPRRSLTDRAE